MHIPTLADYYDIVPHARSLECKRSNYQRLEVEDVENIRALLKTKTINQVAKETNVSYHRIWHIHNKLTYAKR
jgi:molybdenum-dependent DNA-binding transcriptional regulator ModE